MKGRPEAFFLEQFSEKFMDHVRQVCTFAKSIPGFKCLHHEVRNILGRPANFNLYFFRTKSASSNPVSLRFSWSDCPVSLITR